jgi:adenine C2-methylase RlmN of 23S rRNA A2503 and tRNA A37
LSGERRSRPPRRGGNVLQVEYVLLEGINDSDEHAHELGSLLHARSVYVNLIPYNPSNSRVAYRAPTAERVQRMRSILIDHFGLQVGVRTERGSDIAGACGQLLVPTGRAGASCGVLAGEPGCAQCGEDDVRLLLPDFCRSMWR